jgi:hypothetical protein
MKTPSYFLLLLLTITIFSCIDKSIPDFSECTASGSLEKSVLATELIGTWEWQFMVCCPESDEGMKKDSKVFSGTKITFYDDGTGLKEDKSGSANFSWALNTVDLNYYGIDSEPRIGGLWGRLFICDAQMLTNDSYRDGADNYFKKINNIGIRTK